ncbi:MAG: serine hydrolase [Litorimonas sp.]
MFKSRLTRAFPALLGVISLAACTNAGNSEGRFTDHMKTEIEAMIEPWISDSAPGVAIAISLDDDLVYKGSTGLANLESGQHIKPESVFQVASISKQFTAFATLLLVSEGQIDLDVDIRTYIPELNETPRVITTRHLMDHTSGLRESGTLLPMAGWQDDDVVTQEKSIEMIARQNGVNFLAGEEVEYNNSGYVLLAEIIARVSGQSFQSFMQERVFDPLKMTSTRFRGSRNDIIMGRIPAYYPNGETFNKVTASSERVGSTGLLTNAIDLLKWAENFETQTVGNNDVFSMMAERGSANDGENSTFAKGHELRPYKGLNTWSHGGTDEGYKTFILRVPEEDLELIILSNRDDFDTAKLAFALVDTILSKSPNFENTSPAAFDPATPLEMESYAGDYEFYPGIIFSLRAEKDGLTFASMGDSRDELVPLPQIGEREFLLNERTNLSLIFAEPGVGKSLSVKYQIGLHGAIVADRINLAPFDPENMKIEAYVGTYWSEDLQTRYTIEVKDGQLIANHTRLSAFELTPYQKDTFIGNGPLQKLEFITAKDENVTGFYASAPLADRVKFIRIE